MELQLKVPSSALRRLLLGLVAFELLLVAAHLGLHAVAPDSGLRYMFNLDNEHTFPSHFAAMQLFLIGAVLLLLGPPTVGREGVARWFLLLAGAAFVFLSADEMLALHERITRNLRDVAWLPRFRGDHGMWIPIYGGLAVASVPVLWPQLRHLVRIRPPAMRLAAAGALLLGFGGVVLEVPTYLLQLRQDPGWLYVSQVALEEFCEMAGGTLLLGAAFHLVLDRAPTPRRPATMGPGVHRAPHRAATAAR